MTLVWTRLLSRFLFLSCLPAAAIASDLASALSLLPRPQSFVSLGERTSLRVLTRRVLTSLRPICVSGSGPRNPSYTGAALALGG